MKGITVYASDEVHRQLKTLAAKRGTTLSALVSQALREFLDRAEPPSG